MRFQPSASTKSINLNGNATNTGDSIIMPRDIRMLETTMSITRNGMKIMKPIWNAVFSSLVAKAGTRMRRGAVSAVTLESSLASRANSAKSDRRVGLGHGLLKTDGIGAVGQVGVFVDAVKRRPHHKKGQEQRQAHHHLVRGR